ncbi:sensor histidine kinase [Peribacillus sp. R9-11]|uniref:sensor histidine kinase n=1 Tax=Peribacillus sp. R9-11 TaxID=3073271 RepID=UPI002869615C|nr:sensor histidine kinase [Peribacillus sp. R9-11]WMX54941.1 sensor histidine kinase [Peribacillus sp. R9-11]
MNEKARKGVNDLVLLLPSLIEKVGIIVIAAFLLSYMKPFRQMIGHEHQMSKKIMLIALFGAFGIISNYTGVEIGNHVIPESVWHTEIAPDNAIANTRIMGVAIGGLLGGPFVGLGVGLIAGLHRYSLGGFTAGACAIAAILAGVLSGFLGNRRRKYGMITPWFALPICMALEAIQMVIILLTAKPFERAWELVEVIGLPMIIINGFGTLLFMLIIQSTMRDEARTRAVQTNLAFLIADQTLPYFRQGLNQTSCKKIAQIILGLTEADAVAITNEHSVLAHVGAASDHHVPKEGIATGLTRKALEQGKIIIAKTRKDIYCFHELCPLQAAVVLPLQVQQKTVGTLKMYFKHPDKLSQVEQELAEGLAKLFSTQLELAEAEMQTKLLKDAEIKALQAQVHPHFLFNAINTISVLCRTDVEKARNLLLELSAFFRSNLQGARQILIPLEKELEHVNAYLSLELARFPNKYHIVYRIEPSLKEVLLPPFTLQPLVENAIHHAFPHVKSNVEIIIHVYFKNEMMCIVVEDNGKGISSEKLDELGKHAVKSNKGTGTALYNISERLEGIYNGHASLSIESETGHGTQVKISIPLNEKGVYVNDDESIYRRR